MNLEEQIEEIKILYAEGKSQREIAQILKYKFSDIRKLFDDYNIKIRTNDGNNRKYKHNLEFFKEINSEENAYFLGLLYADGCVYEKNETSYGIELGLQISDITIIEKFKNIISKNSKIVIRKHKLGKDSATVKIYSKEIGEQLISLGCVPRKSLILNFPTFLPEHLIHHFIRGFSDGDGSIHFSFSKTKNKCFGWDLISTNEFIKYINLYLKEKLNLYSSLTSPAYALAKNKNTIILRVGGNLQVERALDWLYKDATIYLPRKFNKYMELKELNASKIKKEPILQPIP